MYNVFKSELSSRKKEERKEEGSKKELHICIEFQLEHQLDTLKITTVITMMIKNHDKLIKLI